MQSNGGVHIAVATAKVSSWMGLMQTNGGVHMRNNTATIATTQCDCHIKCEQEESCSIGRSNVRESIPCAATQWTDLAGNCYWKHIMTHLKSGYQHTHFPC